MKYISIFSLAGLLFLVVFATGAAAKGGKNQVTNSSSVTSTSTLLLDPIEISHLTFMREEEKLARDVYLTFAERYPQQPVFASIATKSEQTHTDTMLDKLDQYGIADPNPETNNLPDSLGIFSVDTEWGPYFSKKFATLTTTGSISELDALYVGALIEELDMHDIIECPQVMIDAGYTDPCGLKYTDEQGIINAYNFLLDGSENHLRSYVGQIEAVIGQCNYIAQYIEQEVVDSILNRTCS
jgi:hypothetical protein